MNFVGRDYLQSMREMSIYKKRTRRVQPVQELDVRVSLVEGRQTMNIWRTSHLYSRRFRFVELTDMAWI